MGDAVANISEEEAKADDGIPPYTGTDCPPRFEDCDGDDDGVLNEQEFKTYQVWTQECQWASINGDEKSAKRLLSKHRLLSKKRQAKALQAKRRALALQAKRRA